MKRLWPLARRYGIDTLIVLAAIQGMVIVAVSNDDAKAPTSPLWFAVPATALLILPLLARRRYPFAVPFWTWLFGSAVSFIDGNLIPFTSAVSAAGLLSAFLLGNLRNNIEAWLGLFAAVCGAAIVVFNDPTHEPAELFFVPLFFSIGWLAGYALRERAEQAEAAEVRAAQAERERDAAKRIAVAEERARIAREERLEELGYD